MALRVVGAGIGRTGTHSLKLALERLLGGRCYHMVEVFEHLDDHVPMWQAACDDAPVDWDALFDGYVAAVDWPVGAFWQPLSERYPDALVLLSTRDVDDWWRSASGTIFHGMTLDAPPPLAAWRRMTNAMMRRFDERWQDEVAAKAAFLRHNDAVRAGVPAGRLLEWRPGDGWAPICDALGLPVPDDPFPHVNTTGEFRSRMGWD